jgi:hypothetical protein
MTNSCIEITSNEYVPQTRGLCNVLMQKLESVCQAVMPELGGAGVGKVATGKEEVFGEVCVCFADHDPDGGDVWV